MKVLIAGSRSIENFDLSGYIPPDVKMIITGGAKGIDTVAERYADDNGIEKTVIRPQYDLYGRAAPIKRNEQMVDMADFVLIIWDGKSKGSQYTAKYAQKKNKAVKIVLV
ncbi:MAG: hypothetical protein IJX74_05460 [Clostridia bacterium]|nr:hypothetical protein [Clostridia bacterium]